MAVAIVRTTKDIRVDIETQVNAYNEAFNSDANSLERQDKMADAIDSLATLEQEYARSAKYEKIRDLANTDKPMVNAISNPVYTCIRHRTTKADGVDTGIEVVSRSANIDLLDLDKHTKYTASHTKGWEHYVSRFNALVVLRTAQELGLNLNTIKKTYYMSDKVKKIEMGQTPTSNTQMLKQLQMVVDAIVFEDDGKGGNKYKATSHDIKYILSTCTKAGKEMCQVLVSKDVVLRRIILNVLHNIVTGCGYTISGYKTID